MRIDNHEVACSHLCFFYLLIGQRFFQLWLKFFHQDVNLAPTERRLSLLVLSVGTIFWPIVVPVSYLKLLEEKLENHKISLKRNELN